VGGGVAGLVAAYAVLETGGRVVILERAPRCLGSPAKADGGVSATGTRAQTERGVADSADLFAADIVRSGPRRADLARALCENGGRDLDWLIGELGLEQPILEQHHGHSVPRTHLFGRAETSSLLGRALHRALEKAARESGRVRIVTGAHVTQLLTDCEGSCCGCAYLHGGLETNERGPVVLCSGGFTANHAQSSLLARHRPDLLHLPVSSRYSTGDGLWMAEAIGARTIDLEWIQVHPTGLVKLDDPDAKSKLIAAKALREAGGLILDQQGCRICDEHSSDDSIVCAMWKNKAPFRLVLNAAAADDVMSLCERYEDLGTMKLFKSGAALAKDMGVLLSTLEATFEAQHQASIAADNDADEGLQIGSPDGTASAGKRFCQNSIPGTAVANEPFYVAIVTPVLHCCLGGLEVSSSGAVLGHGDRVIRGLYAAGEVASGVSGTCYLSGNALLECIVLGRAAGRASAELAFAGDIGEPDVSQVPHAAPSPSATRGAADAAGAISASEPAQGDGPKGAQDVRRLSAAMQLERVLESRLTASTLQKALAMAHSRGGDMEAVREALRSTILGEADAEQGRPFLQMSLRDPAGMPAAVATAPLPDVGSRSSEVPISCVHCRSSLSLGIFRDMVADQDDVQSPSAYATLLYGAKIEYFLGALVIGWSLKASGTTKDLLLLHTTDVPAPFLNVLARHWILRQVDYLEGSQKMYKNYYNSRFKAVFTKLQALSCTDYAKVLMMDLDMLVRGPGLDELFLLPTPAALKRSSGKEQPAHGGTYSAQDMWRSQRDDMCSGINAGVMLLAPDQRVYERMVAEIQDQRHPEHIGTYGPEQDYLARFYSVFGSGLWTHIHAKFNYQLMLPEDYCSSAHKALDVERDVVVAHYSGPRVKPWKLDGGDLDSAGLSRLLRDDSVQELFGRDQWAASRERLGQRPQTRERVMDGVLVVEEATQSSLPQSVRAVMWEWVLALRKCVEGLREEGVDVPALVREVEAAER